MRPATNNQFSLARFCRVAYEWIGRENINRLNDFLDPLVWIFHLKIYQVVNYALKILTDFWRQLNGCHINVPACAHSEGWRLVQPLLPSNTLASLTKE